MDSLLETFGPIDIYLFDQLLKGRITPRQKVLDAGCGAGRNLIYLLKLGCDVSAIDAAEQNMVAVRRLAGELAPHLGEDRFPVGRIEALPFADGTFDTVLCSAVLHFARDEEHFHAMVGELWRVLRPGGLLFTRLASSIGIEDRIDPIGGRRFALPDGSERFLVDEALLLTLTDRLGGSLVDPLKTTNVQGLRCMTTWCLEK